MNARNATYDILWRETFGPDGPERGNSTFYSGWTVADVARTTAPQPGWATREQTWTMGPPGTPGGLRTATDLSHALGKCTISRLHVVIILRKFSTAGSLQNHKHARPLLPSCAA